MYPPARCAGPESSAVAERRLGCWVAILLGGVTALGCACGGLVAWDSWGEPAWTAWKEVDRWVAEEPDVRAWVGDPPERVPRAPDLDVIDPDTVRVTVNLRGPKAAGALDLELHRVDGAWRVASAMRQGPDGPYPLAEEPAVAASHAPPGPAAAAPLVESARGLAEQKQWKAAEEMADRALALVPDHPEALAIRGLARVQTDQLAIGADDLRRAVQLDPDAVEAWSALDWAEARLGNDDAAIRAWTERIRRVPSDARARAARADARFRVGDRAGALEDAGESCRMGWAAGCTLEQRIAATPR